MTKWLAWFPASIPPVLITYSMQKGMVSVDYSERSTNHPKKYKRWTEESTSGAMKCIMDGRVGVNRAADEHGVPRTTLKDRIAEEFVHGTLSGPQPSKAAEKELQRKRKAELRLKKKAEREKENRHNGKILCTDTGLEWAEICSNEHAVILTL